MSLSSEPDTSKPFCRLKVIDLFSGLGGWSAAFKDRGHDVITLDNNRNFECDIRKNILDVSTQDFPWKPDIVLASPPCDTFSLLISWANWTSKNSDNPNQPKTIKAKLAYKVLEKTLSLIDELAPRYFIIENPRAKMRHMPVMARYERRTVTYCQYGLPYQKPTDLWGMFPPSLVMRPTCNIGDPCHEKVIPGTHKGVARNISAAERAVVPYQLSLEVCLAAEAGGAPNQFELNL
jgi:site-specific DNA-cytosine methylase